MDDSPLVMSSLTTGDTSPALPPPPPTPLLLSPRDPGSAFALEPTLEGCVAFFIDAPVGAVELFGFVAFVAAAVPVAFMALGAFPSSNFFVAGAYLIIIYTINS